MSNSIGFQTLLRGCTRGLLALLLASGAAHAAIPASERQALLDLYASTNGAGWTNKTNWNGPAGTECTWYGVTCNLARTRVDFISLNSNHLVGPLPALDGLPGLSWLDLSRNQLSGSIPSSIANRFVWLYLASNQLSGSIPPFSNPGLISLDLSGNQLSGSIPSFAANLALQQLHLDSNQLSGTIPSFASNNGLMDLGLSFNQLSGSIPSFAANTFLEYLNLTSNQLTGPIPSLPATYLTMVLLDSNRLSGPIPSLAANTQLQLLHLSSNQLAGPVDASLGTLTNLVAGGLDLRWNALSSTNPTLTAFLNSKQYGGDWQSTQTIPVTGLGASGITGTQVILSWTPIVYTGDAGNYKVSTSTASGGPYIPFSTVTANKSAASLTVTGLAPGTPTFFVVQTTTAPHASNQNTVLSGQSAELRAVTTGAPQETAQVPAAGTTALLVFVGLLSSLGALRVARAS